MERDKKMTSIDDLKESKYLTQRDVDPAKTFTMAGAEKEDVSLESESADMKLVLRFQDEGVKPLVVNWTNQNLIAAAVGSRNIEDWVGKPVTLYRDPSIMFKGNVKGGIRVEVPRQAPAATTMPTPGQQVDYDQASEQATIDNDIPF